MRYAVALATTLVVEVPVSLLVFHFARLLPRWRGVAAAIGVNLVTHPLVWLLLTVHPGWFFAVEATVCLVEAGLLLALVRRDALLLLVTAVAANSASVLAGTVLFGLSRVDP